MKIYDENSHADVLAAGFPPIPAGSPKLLLIDTTGDFDDTLVLPHAECVRFLGVNGATLRHWVMTHKVRHYFQKYYDVEDVRRELAKGRKRGRPAYSRGTSIDEGCASLIIAEDGTITKDRYAIFPRGSVITSMEVEVG